MPGSALLVFPADDDASGLVMEILAARGWEHQLVAGSAQALAGLVRIPAGTAPPGLLVISAALPGMGPWALARAVRSLPGLGRIPAIILGTAVLDGLEAARAIPADDLAAFEDAMGGLLAGAVPVTADPDSQILDQPIVASLKEIPGLWARAVGMLSADLPGRIIGIEQSVAAADLAEVHRQAHALKGAVGSLGARRLHDLVDRIDAAALASDLPLLRSLAPELRTLGGRTLSALQAA